MKLRKYIAALCIFLFTFYANAQTLRYVRAGASGAGTGLNWTDAFTVLPASLSRGFVYYIAAGTYAGHTFNDVNSSTTTITVQKATVADHGTSTGWLDSYASGVALFGAFSFTTDYYTINGATGGGPGQWETGFGMKIQSGGQNITLSGARTQIKFYHLEVQNNGRATGSPNENCLYAIGSPTDILVSSNYWHDVSICFFFTRGSTRVTAEYSKFARNGQGDWIDGNHREFWTATTDNDEVIRYCILEDICNTAVIGVVNGTGNADNWLIYGNVIWWTGTYGDAYCSALIDVRNDSPQNVGGPAANPSTFMVANNWRIYNNSIVGWVNGSSAGIRIGVGSGNIAYNNIWYTNTANEISFWNTTHDYNYFFRNNRYGPGCESGCNKDNAGETHQQTGTSNPFVNYTAKDFRLIAATTAGTTLGSPYTTDALGSTRGGDGVWDRGAYEFGVGAPAAPYNLTVGHVFINKAN